MQDGRELDRDFESVQCMQTDEVSVDLRILLNASLRGCSGYLEGSGVVRPGKADGRMDVLMGGTSTFTDIAGAFRLRTPSRGMLVTDSLLL